LSAGTKRLSDLTCNQIDEVLAALGQQYRSAQTAKADKMLRLTDYMSSVDLQYPTPVAQVVVAAAEQPAAPDSWKQWENYFTPQPPAALWPFLMIDRVTV
jgi:hypothetical protein